MPYYLTFSASHLFRPPRAPEAGFDSQTSQPRRRPSPHFRFDDSVSRVIVLVRNIAGFDRALNARCHASHESLGTAADLNFQSTLLISAHVRRSKHA